MLKTVQGMPWADAEFDIWATIEKRADKSAIVDAIKCCLYEYSC